MATTVNDLRGWFNGWHTWQDDKPTHMIVVCDTFDYSDYPHYFTGTADEAREEVRKMNGVNMQKIMEVYSYNLPFEEQAKEFRAFNY